MNNMPPFPVLECSTITFRTIFRKEWIRPDGSVKWQAFKPYLADKSGVSAFMTLADVREHSDNPFFGVMSVHVGKIRDCSNDVSTLDVVQDKAWHANIKGIPFPYLDDGTEDKSNAEKMRDFCAAIISTLAARPCEYEL